MQEMTSEAIGSAGVGAVEATLSPEQLHQLTELVKARINDCLHPQDAEMDRERLPSDSELAFLKQFVRSPKAAIEEVLRLENTGSLWGVAVSDSEAETIQARVYKQLGVTSEFLSIYIEDNSNPTA